MSGKGVKRASPGADEEKNPLGDVALSDDDASKLQDLQQHYHRVELAVGASPLPCRAPPPTCLTESDGLQSAARPSACSPCTRSGAPC